MTAIHKELAFEDAICAHLAANGWLYEPGAAARYDRAHALFPEDLAAWLQQTQPDAWDSLVKTHGPPPWPPSPTASAPRWTRGAR